MCYNVTMKKLLTLFILGLLFLTLINLNYVQANSKEDITLQEAQYNLVKDWWKERATATNSYDYNLIKLNYVQKLKTLRKEYGN